MIETMMIGLKGQGSRLVSEVVGTEQTTPEGQEQARLEALSKEILGEDLEPGAIGAGGEPNKPATAPAEGAPGEPVVGTGGVAKPDTAKLPGWQRGMPESLRGRLEGMSNDEVEWLRSNAEDGLRQADYSRLTGSLPGKEQLALLTQSHEALEAIKQDPDLAVRLFGGANGEDPGGGEETSVKQLAQALMDQTDPEEFADTLEKMLSIHGESVKESLRQESASAPESKAHAVNAAAARIREALGEGYPEESWNAACADYAKECEANGTDWRDTPPNTLAFLLKPYLKLHRPTATSPSHGVPQAPRAAAMLASGGTGVSTETLTQAQRENREETEDEIFDRTLLKFGTTEQQLAQLRSRGL